MAPTQAARRHRSQAQSREIIPTAATAARFVLVAFVVYLAIDLALVFLRPEFSVLHNAESDYGSRGSWGWVMDLNFLLRGLLSLAAVRAIALTTETSSRLRLALGLLTVWAIASGLLAFFPDDPVGTTTHGTGVVHGVLAFLAFSAVAIGTILASIELRTQARWRSVGLPLAVLAWGALLPLGLLIVVGFHTDSLGGLCEKTFIFMELLWMVLAAAHVALGRGGTSIEQDSARGGVT